MIRSIKLKPILIEGQVLSYVVDDLELNEELIQSYFNYDRKTIDALSRVYRLILENLYNSIGFEDRDLAFREYMREGVLRHTFNEIENWKSNMKSLLEREQIQKKNPEDVLYKKQIDHLVNISAIDTFEGFTSYLRSEQPPDDIVSESTEEDDQG